MIVLVDWRLRKARRYPPNVACSFTKDHDGRRAELSVSLFALSRLFVTRVPIAVCIPGMYRLLHVRTAGVYRFRSVCNIIFFPYLRL